MCYQKNYAAGRPQMYDTISREEKASRMVKLLETIYPKELNQLTILDIASSTGIIDNFLANYFKEVTGTDIDKNAVDFARSQFKKKNLKFRVEDALNLSFDNNSFDVVICTHVYEHVTNPKKMFSEIYRVLKPGGICYLAAVNKWWIIEPHYNLPFLSFLPKKLANIYISLFTDQKKYFETPKSYWQLKNLTQKFGIKDYTPLIFKRPSKYGYDSLERNLVLRLALQVSSPVIKYFSPTFFWILKKD